MHCRKRDAVPVADWPDQSNSHLQQRYERGFGVILVIYSTDVFKSINNIVFLNRIWGAHLRPSLRVELPLVYHKNYILE